MKTLPVAYQILLLIAIILAVFYPSIFAEICLIDDVQAISSLLNTEHFSLIDNFFPRSSGGGYYRPLIGLSYWIDKELWFVDTALLHLEIIVAHIINGLLVYFITRESTVLLGLKQDSWLSMAAGLLFALHPVVTESVNWISGRTDVMMGNFVLCGFLLLLKYKRFGSIYHLCISLFLSFIALFAKESAFGYLIAIPLFIFFKLDVPEPTNIRKRLAYSFLISYAVAVIIALYLDNYWLVLVVAGIFLVINIRGKFTSYGLLLKSKSRFGLLAGGIFLSISAFYIIRKIAFVSNVDKIGMTIKLMLGDLNYSISLFLGAAGFYVKKFIMPLPLNFFIIEIDPIYDLAGIAVLLLVLYLMLVRTLPALLCLTGVFLMLPAFPFAFGTIAWTAYAERYIYLSSAFWVVAICLWLGQRFQNCSELQLKLITLLTAGVISLAAVTTYSRNIVWQKNVTLFENTVSQTPKVRKIRDLYMAALLDAGYNEEAKKQFYIAASLPDSLYLNRYDDRGYLLMGNLLKKEGRFIEALKLYDDAITRTKHGSEELIVAALDSISLVLPTIENRAEQMRLERLRDVYVSHLKSMTTNPSRLIEFGKSAAQHGSFDEAVQLYDKALEFMTDKDQKRSAVMRLRDQSKRR